MTTVASTGLAYKKTLPVLPVTGWGYGLAVCSLLRCLVVSDGENNSLAVFKVRANGTFVLLHVIGCSGAGPLQFAFGDDDTDGWHIGCDSGFMCFTVGGVAPTLLVTEAGNDRVQEVDVLARTHVGFPVTVARPRGVAASASLIAVSAWKWGHESAVHVIDAASRAPLFTIGLEGGDVEMWRPYGLRLSADGAFIVVAIDDSDMCVSAFRTTDGAFSHIITTTMWAYDVEECQGGWLVVGADAEPLQFFGTPSAASSVVKHADLDEGWPSALAIMPGVGLFARVNTRVQVYSTPDSRRFAGMSAARVAWLGCLHRAATARAVALPRTRARRRVAPPS